MNPEPENFERLRRLLIVKRHEQPPPGFFEGFSRRVIARLEAGETGEVARAGLWRVLWPGDWLGGFWDALERRPALAGAFGLSVGGLLLTGILCSVAPAGSGNPALTRGSLSLAATAAAAPEPAEPSAVFVSSTNGVLPAPLQDSLFERLGAPQAQPQFIRVNEPLVSQ
jgi:hypothetical protein